MRNLRLLQRHIKFMVLVAVLAAMPHPVGAQQPQTITGTGTIVDVAYCGDGCNLTVTFPPTGGPVTGTAIYQGGMIRVISEGETTMGMSRDSHLLHDRLVRRR